MKKTFIQLHIAIFLAGFTGILGLLIKLNEGLLVWYRLLITAATMWVLFSFTKRIQKIAAIDILKLIGVGFLLTLHWVSFFGSIKQANVSIALVCFSSVGFFTALLEPLIYKSRINYFDILLGLMVIAGIYIIFHFDPRYKTGIALGIVSALLLAFIIIFIRQFIQRINSETILTWQMTGGFLSLSLLLPYYINRSPLGKFFPSAEDWFWLLVLAWGCSVLAFLLSTAALKKLSAFTVNLLYNLEPVYGIILAFIFFKENKTLSSEFFIGLGLILFSVVLQMWRLLRKRTK